MIYRYIREDISYSFSSFAQVSGYLLVGKPPQERERESERYTFTCVLFTLATTSTRIRIYYAAQDGGGGGGTAATFTSYLNAQSSLKCT